jgi:hypothetical protein
MAVIMDRCLASIMVWLDRESATSCGTFALVIKAALAR